MKTIETQLVISKKWLPVKLVYTHDRIFFFSKFSKGLNAEIKMMEGHNYHGYEGAPLRDFVIKTFKIDKIWSVKDTQHNAFQLDYLQGKKPYARYKKELVDCLFVRDCLRNHQMNGVKFLLIRKQCILAGQMGVGKTLTDIEAREIAKPQFTWYVAPRSALRAVDLELKKWNAKIWPEMFTYQGLVKRVKMLEGQDIVPPQWLTLDESSCVKNPTSQRSQAAKIIADAMRDYWGDDCYIVLMTGTPSPQSPLDWWMQCHIARPGYLIEGSYEKLRSRLAVVVEKDYGSGVFPYIETWKDRAGICDICGKTEQEHIILDSDHEYKPAINEVEKLHRRLDGLVLFQFKKDCLDLPEKQYEKIYLEPSKKLVQIARTIAQTSPSVAEALIRLRTLSDGFLYKEEKVGEETCPLCSGSGQTQDHVIIDSEKPEFDESNFEIKTVNCIKCHGKGQIPVMRRFSEETACPKEQALRDLIQRHEEVCRIVIYAGFTGSVDRCVRILKDLKWEYIRWDGRGIECSIPSDVDPILMFQNPKEYTQNIGFVDQPGAAGMCLTLTASPSCVYWSNTFNTVDRLQSEDRIHRLGMDENRGATIYDLFHLPTDQLVYNKIMEKSARQNITMGIDVNMVEIMESLNA